ncbi:hypothetical protein HBH77_174970 [Parastagonospora nodorum]|nr:hypothetical protein HBH77_174970 [Parastagonospora nodorum]
MFGVHGGVGDVYYRRVVEKHYGRKSAGGQDADASVPAADGEFLVAGEPFHGSDTEAFYAPGVEVVGGFAGYGWVSICFV